MSHILPTTNYIVFDFETTGFTAGRDEVIQMSAMYYQEGKEPEFFNEYINIGKDLPQEITQLTGITNEILKEKGIPKKEAWRKFYKFLRLKEGVPLVGHNCVSFDRKFLEATLTELGCAKDFLPKRELYIDTAMLYKARILELKPDEKETHFDFCLRIGSMRVWGIKFNLGVCCKELAIDITKFTAHQSDSDIQMTHLVYQKLLAELVVIEEALPF